MTAPTCERCQNGIRGARGPVLVFTHPDDPDRELATCTPCIRELAARGIVSARPLRPFDADALRPFDVAADVADAAAAAAPVKRYRECYAGCPKCRRKNARKAARP